MWCLNPPCRTAYRPQANPRSRLPNAPRSWVVSGPKSTKPVDGTCAVGSLWGARSTNRVDRICALGLPKSRKPVYEFCGYQKHKSCPRVCAVRARNNPKAQIPSTGCFIFDSKTTQKHKSRPRTGGVCAEYDSNVHNIETVEKFATVSTST